METLNIEIGCPPGNPRPNEILMNILSELKKNENQEICSWAEQYLQTPPEYTIIFGDLNCNLIISGKIIEKVQTVFQNKLTEMYDSGIIRYASW